MMLRTSRAILYLAGPALLLSCEPGTAPEAPPRISVTLPISQIEVSDTLDLGVLVTNASGNELTDVLISWTSSNSAVATISGTGRVIAVGAGSVTLSASAKGVTATASLTVVDPIVTQILLAPSIVAPRVSQSVPVTAVLRDKRARAIAGRTITWTSDPTSVATVDATGTVQAVSAGTATITATAGAQSASVQLTITPVPVISVSVSESAVSMLISQTRTLSASPRDSVGGALAGREIQWSSANPAVAAVTQAGVVTALSAGTTTVTATSEGISSSSTIQVAPVPVSSVVISPTSASRIVTLTAQFTATTRDSTGATLVGRTVTWSTSNALVASINASGLVTANGQGTATITATSEGRSTSATMTVLPVPVSTVTVTPAAPSMFVGETVGLTAVLRDSVSTLLTSRPITWSSSAPTVATVTTGGLVAAVGPGTATITATSEGKTGSVTVTSRMKVASVSITPSPLNLLVGQVQAITATPRDSTGAALTDRGIAWSSSNSLVAAVSGTGVLTPTGAGVATVTASSEGKSAQVTVTVVPVPVASVNVTPATRNLYVTQTQQLSAATLDSIGGTLSGRTVAWSTSSDAIATVSPTGLVTAIAPGVATITGTVEGKTNTSTITVALVPIVSVTLEAPRLGIRIGEDMQLTATPRDSVNGALTGRTVTWLSSAPGVLGIDANGFVTAVAAGTSTVTATSEGQSANILITVSPVPVTSVSVSPSSPLILAGATIQLTATPKDSAGRALIDRPVVWASTNGAVATVDGTGLVTGVAPGIVSITAVSEDSIGAASITVVSALHPNEPPLLSLLSERQFNALTEDGWGSAFMTNLSVASDDASPKSPTSIGNVVFPVGFVGGNEPINIYKVFLAPQPETLYVSFWVKLSPNWVSHPSGVNKIFHIFIAGLNRVYISAQGTGSATSALQPQVRLQQIASDGGFRNLTPNLVPGVQIVRGQWHRWDIVLVTNTLGNANGSAEWFIDGVKVGQYSNIGYVTEVQSHTWHSINWAPTWGGVGTTIAVDQIMSIDHIYVAGR